MEASIAGLSAEQNRAIAAAYSDVDPNIGDLILISIYPKREDSDSGDAEGEDDGEEGEEGSEDERESVDEDSEAENEESKANEVDEDQQMEGVQGAELSDAPINGSHDPSVAGALAVQAGNTAGQSTEDQENPFGAHVYLVNGVVVDKSGIIKDLSICKLTYCAKPNDMTSLNFCFYADDVRGVKDMSDIPAGNFIKMTDLISNEETHIQVLPSCSGLSVLNLVFHGECPAGCDQGWLENQAALHELADGTLATIAEHQPVCPVCIGYPLMREYQGLREMLEQGNGVLDLGIVVEFYGRLNPVRNRRGYDFIQFDEREWGYLFDDMLSESDEGEQDGNRGWAYYDDALDPSANIVHKPAAADAIAALPRKLFAEVKKDDEEVECLVCKEKFADDATVVEMPCGHFFCASGCIEQWLKQFNTCPACRAPLPLEKEVDRATGAVDGIDEDVSEKDDGEIDGEDSVMSDHDDADQIFPIDID